MPRKPNKKTLVLHGGTAKTGSSYLQKSMSAQADLFRAHDIYYPHTGQNALFKDAGHHLLVQSLMQDRWAELDLTIAVPDSETLWKSLAREVAASDCGNALVSSEWFAFDVYREEDIRTIKAALAQFNVKIVFIFRDVVQFVNSAYSQRVRDGFDGTIADYVILAWPHLNWKLIAQRWIDVFGEKNVICLSYQYLKDRDYLPAFIRSVFGKSIPTEIDVAPDSAFRNGALSPSATKAIREINASALPPREKELARDEIRRLYDAMNQSFALDFLSADLAALLRHTCQWPQVYAL